MSGRIPTSEKVQMAVVVVIGLAIFAVGVIGMIGGWL